MKPILVIITLFVSLAVSAQKQPGSPQPTWNVSFHFDHISFPFFGKYKPVNSIKSLRSFTRSWRVSVGRTFLNTGADHSGGFRTINIGYLKNAHLQHGFSFSVQQGFHWQANRETAVFFQPAVEAGGLLLLQKTNSTVHKKRFNQKNLRWQWTAGIALNAGYAKPIQHTYAASALSYKLWLQGPFIKKYAPAVPHQSIGLVVYK